MSANEWALALQTIVGCWLGLCITVLVLIAATADNGSFLVSVWNAYVTAFGKALRWVGVLLRGGRR